MGKSEADNPPPSSGTNTIKRPERINATKKLEAEKRFRDSMNNWEGPAKAIQAFYQWSLLASPDDPEFLKCANWLFDQFSEDAHEAFSFASGIPLEGLRERLQSKAAIQLARKSPLDATKLAIEIPLGSIRTAALKRIGEFVDASQLQEWLRMLPSEDIDAGIAIIGSKKNISDQSTILLIERLTQSEAHARSLNKLIHNIPREQLAMSLKKLISLNISPNDKAFDTGLASLASSDINSAINILNELLNHSELKPEAQKSLIHRLGSSAEIKSVNEALSWAKKLPNQSDSLDLLLGILAGNQTLLNDPELISSLENDNLPDSFILQVKRERDLTNKANVVDRNNLAQKKAAWDLGKQIASQDPRDTLVNFEQHFEKVAPNLRQEAKNSWFSAIFQADLASAERALAQIPELANDDNIRNISNHYLQYSGELTMRKMSSLMHETGNSQFVKIGLSEWLKSNRSAAMEWANSQPENSVPRKIISEAPADIK
jgi:hypothetical protein